MYKNWLKKYISIIMNETELEQKLFDLRMQLVAIKAQIKLIKTELWERKADKVYKLALQETHEQNEKTEKGSLHSSGTTLLSNLNKVENSEQLNVKLFKASYGIPYNTSIDSMIEQENFQDDE